MAEKKELYGYEEDDILTLEFDDGEEDPLGTEDVYLYGYKEYEEDYELIDIADEDEFAKVVKEFEQLAVEEA